MYSSPSPSRPPTPLLIRLHQLSLPSSSEHTNLTRLRSDVKRLDALARHKCFSYASHAVSNRVWRVSRVRTDFQAFKQLVLLSMSGWGAERSNFQLS